MQVNRDFDSVLRAAQFGASLSLVALVLYGPTGCKKETPTSDFARAVDLSPLESVAVQEEGRLKSFDAFSRGTMNFITGMKSIAGQSHAFTYFDMMFRPDAYIQQPSIYVKKKLIRQDISRALAEREGVAPAVLEEFMRTGLIAPQYLVTDSVRTVLDTLERDVIRGEKAVGAILSAFRVVTRPELLSARLRIIPRPDGDDARLWYTVEDLAAAAVPQDDTHAGLAPEIAIPGLDEAIRSQLSEAWNNLRESWTLQDAAGVNRSVAELAAAVGQVSPHSYPDQARLQWQSWYFRNKSMTWVWIIYITALVPLLIGVIYRWKWAHRIGLGMFGVAFAFHTAALGLRWYIAERWPNSNMFEAVTTSAWFGGAGALLLELWVRRKALRGLFALSSAGASMTALMCASFMPVALNSNISNMMPILSDLWLYIHTNVVIYSYCLIFMAGLTGIMYLVYRAFGGNKAVAKSGGAGTLILDSGKAGGFLQTDKVGAGQVLDAATMVLMELAFILLWAGLVMGAIWADHSWGRPWGWDPKEVFALCTFLVFMILVHVRFKVRDKGLWTAALAVAGSLVMLFNWIVINFKISGLHSYA